LCEQETDDTEDDDCLVDLIDPHLSVVEPPGSALLVCLNGIPDPRAFDEKGPRASWNSESMLYLTPTGGQDCPYYWTQCSTCGYVDAEFTGRAARLSCGHGDGDKDYRAGSPAILSAYSLAGRAVSARWSGASCLGCGIQVQRGDLIVNVGRKWQHARCAYATVATRGYGPSTTAVHSTPELEKRSGVAGCPIV
jgi:hypothetical protein